MSPAGMCKFFSCQLMAKNLYLRIQIVSFDITVSLHSLAISIEHPMLLSLVKYMQFWFVSKLLRLRTLDTSRVSPLMFTVIKASWGPTSALPNLHSFDVLVFLRSDYKLTLQFLQMQAYIPALAICVCEIHYTLIRNTCSSFPAVILVYLCL